MTENSWNGEGKQRQRFRVCIILEIIKINCSSVQVSDRTYEWVVWLQPGAKLVFCDVSSFKQTTWDKQTAPVFNKNRPNRFVHTAGRATWKFPQMDRFSNLFCDSYKYCNVTSPQTKYTALCSELSICLSFCVAHWEMKASDNVFALVNKRNLNETQGRNH